MIRLTAEALDWLVDDDGLQISPDAPNLLQRYILALLYFATNGSNWEFSYNWLGPVHECQWRNERGDQYEVYAGVFNCSAFDKVTSLELGKFFRTFSFRHFCIDIRS